MLTDEDCEEISRSVAEGLEFKQIAARVGRDLSVVSREVARHGGRAVYRGRVAAGDAERARERPKPLAVDVRPGLVERVKERLQLGWSPRSISAWLCRDDTGGQTVTVSHEAVYPWVYAQPVGTLRRELIWLRTGRTKRCGPKPAPAPRIREPNYIDERPADAEARACRAGPGHWEGDLVIGKEGKTAVATLVERKSRFLVLVPLTARDSKTVTQAVIAAVGGLPATIKRSLTWDCGSEMALHKDVTATGLPVLGVKSWEQHCW